MIGKTYHIDITSDLELVQRFHWTDFSQLEINYFSHNVNENDPFSSLSFVSQCCAFSVQL